MIRARPLLNQRTAPAEKTRPEWAGNRMAVCVTYPANAGCEFSKEENAYVSYQEKASGEVLP